MKILYLYAEVMGYTMATIRSLLSLGFEIHLVHWDTRKLTPYEPEKNEKVFFYPRSSYPAGKLEKLVCDIKPDIVVVSGWMDKAYLGIAKLLKKRGIPIVVGLDAQWKRTYKKSMASMLGHAGYFKKYFSHVWVSGTYQYEYARRLGFEKEEIVYDLYSADLQIFNGCYSQNLEAKERNYPHRFLFVGRLEKTKAVDLLVDAWRMIDDRKKTWELLFIGNGALKEFLERQNDVVVRDFMQPEAFKEEIASAGCFILPSRYEPWGVVIHEFAAAGLPLICSNVCGAAQKFLINGYNGFTFASEDVNALAEKMLNIIESDDETLRRMGKCSHCLAQRVTPTTSAANLLSVVRKQ